MSDIDRQTTMNKTPLISNERNQSKPNPLREELEQVIKQARRTWSRDDYADETQDEYVLDAIIEFFERRG